MPHDERTHRTEGMGSPRTPIAVERQGSRESDQELRAGQDPQVPTEAEVRVGWLSVIPWAAVALYTLIMVARLLLEKHK